jgi:hypothetical protein
LVGCTWITIESPLNPWSGWHRHSWRRTRWLSAAQWVCCRFHVDGQLVHPISIPTPKSNPVHCPGAASRYIVISYTRLLWTCNQ